MGEENLAEEEKGREDERGWKRKREGGREEVRDEDEKAREKRSW